MCVCVCACVRACVCMCVCAIDRERECVRGHLLLVPLGRGLIETRLLYDIKTWQHFPQLQQHSTDAVCFVHIDNLNKY